MLMPSFDAGFNPRLPCGRRRFLLEDAWQEALFQSTPPMREATRAAATGSIRGSVSIHASHAGGDSV